MIIGLNLWHRPDDIGRWGLLMVTCAAENSLNYSPAIDGWAGANTGLACCSQASCRSGYFVGQLAQKVPTFNNPCKIVTSVDNQPSWGLLTHWAGASVSVNIWSQQSSRDGDTNVLFWRWIITQWSSVSGPGDLFSVVVFVIGSCQLKFRCFATSSPT